MHCARFVILCVVAVVCNTDAAAPEDEPDHGDEAEEVFSHHSSMFFQVRSGGRVKRVVHEDAKLKDQFIPGYHNEPDEQDAILDYEEPELGGCSTLARIKTGCAGAATRVQLEGKGGTCAEECAAKEWCTSFLRYRRADRKGCVLLDKCEHRNSVEFNVYKVDRRCLAEGGNLTQKEGGNTDEGAAFVASKASTGPTEELNGCGKLNRTRINCQKEGQRLRLDRKEAQCAQECADRDWCTTYLKFRGGTNRCILLDSCPQWKSYSGTDAYTLDRACLQGGGATTASTTAATTASTTAATTASTTAATTTATTTGPVADAEMGGCATLKKIKSNCLAPSRRVVVSGKRDVCAEECAARDWCTHFMRWRAPHLNGCAMTDGCDLKDNTALDAYTLDRECLRQRENDEANEADGEVPADDEEVDDTGTVDEQVPQPDDPSNYSAPVVFDPTERAHCADDEPYCCRTSYCLYYDEHRVGSGCPEGTICYSPYDYSIGVCNCKNQAHTCTQQTCSAR